MWGGFSSIFMSGINPWMLYTYIIMLFSAPTCSVRPNQSWDVNAAQRQIGLFEPSSAIWRKMTLSLRKVTFAHLRHSQKQANESNPYSPSFQVLSDTLQHIIHNFVAALKIMRHVISISYRPMLVKFAIKVKTLTLVSGNYQSSPGSTFEEKVHTHYYSKWKDKHL